MAFLTRAVAFVVGVLAPLAVIAAPAVTVPTITVGSHLQMWTAIRISDPPSQGVELTLTSDDPTRLLLSKAPDQPGAPTITLRAAPRRIASPEFCLQALADTGTVTYTISAEGIGTIKGTVNLAPSAVTIMAPSRIPRFPTTPHSPPFKITVVSVVLDAAHNISQEQPVAGGSELEIVLSNSNARAGTLRSSKLAIPGGSSSAATFFQPAGEGETTIEPVQPRGFSKPAELGSVVAAVAKPGLAIAGEIFIGKDLQSSALVCLGEPAPPEGLKVTLTSADGTKLLLSAAEDKLGAASLTLTIPAGQLLATYYLQALSGSGDVTYTATAPGFRSRTAPIWLAPSGVILAYEEYGPPDEANVKRKGGVVGLREFFISRAHAEKNPVRLVAWTAYLDRESGRAADFTIQPVRAGLDVTVTLQNSDPAVGNVQSPVVIKSGVNRAYSHFTPTANGSTVISVQAPKGFSKPANATSVPANVVE